ncbi:discoidin domain-containing protein [Kineosporia babensis]|uniref:Discoidin domain-containing protein n=1 Tax=Kineosporia babensis TaxID=499548 RepID=A0A9X1SV67_9ACTN|nr:discoidin domain-containing protein [Kineosporia babensis]MCD5313286.1 discoidin domain-containing protein [Kineosporia babensis]
MARPVIGTRKRLLYSTGLVTGVLGLGVGLIASPAVAGMVSSSPTVAGLMGNSSPAPKPTSAANAGSEPELAVPDRNNLALGKTVTGSAACRAGESADQAVDGELDAKWCSGERRAQLTIDLGEQYHLAAVTVDHAEAGGENAALNTRSFDIRVSDDGQTFRMAAQVRGNTEGQTVSEIDNSARYVQVLVRAPEQRKRGGAARIYEVGVAEAEFQMPDGETTPAATPSTECHADAPEQLTDFVAEHTTPMTRVECNEDVAVYFDDNLKAVPAETTEWVAPFATDVWKYLKSAYGSCAAEPRLDASLGACENFGAPRPGLFFMHKDSYSGGTVNGRFDQNSGFRTVNDIGYGNWDGTDNQVRDIIVHEACHQVEGDSQGRHGSPAFSIWGDSKWAEFCVYDFYANSGRDADAERVKAAFLSSRDDLPAGAQDAAWFQDWFLPLWEEGGGQPDVMENYFGLLAQHFPTQAENDGKNLTYARGMTTGEYVLFTSAAAGKDLSDRAAQAFGAGFDPAEFEQARKDFPELAF